MSAEDKAIQDVINCFWDKYDIDQSGHLVKGEILEFVQETLENLGSGEDMLFFEVESFDEVFSSFDKNDSGTLEKSEMVGFVK